MVDGASAVNPTQGPGGNTFSKKAIFKKSRSQKKPFSKKAVLKKKAVTADRNQA
jgi:hypothetical protein